MKQTNDEIFKLIEEVFNSNPPETTTGAFREIEGIVHGLIKVCKNQEDRIKILEDKPSNI